METRSLHPALHALLDYGPILAFLVSYLLVRNETFLIGGVSYTGFVAVTAAFIPVFVLATGALWLLTGRVMRIQVITLGMLVLFGGLGVWMNDPTLLKMKPTAIYLLLACTLGTGLLRGEPWMRFVLEELVPLKKRGWIILTKRVTVLCLLSALANELVWRSQSEEVWVIFETLAMPVVIFAFVLGQIRLVVEYAAWPSRKKKP